MNDFKFLSFNEPPIHCLINYHDTLDNLYLLKLNIDYEDEKYIISRRIFDNTIDFINNRLLTNYSEIRRFYAICFSSETDCDDIITDNEHRWIISRI